MLFTIMSRAGNSVTKSGSGKSIFGRPAKMSRYESERLTSRRPSDRSSAARLSKSVELIAPVTASFMRASSTACAPASRLDGIANFGISAAASRSVDSAGEFNSGNPTLLRAIALASVSPTRAEFALNFSYCRSA